MNFVDFRFWIALLLCIGSYIAVKHLLRAFGVHVGAAADKIILLLTGLLLLGMASPLTLAIYVSITLSAYGLLRVSNRLSLHQKRILWLLFIPLLLLPLAYYKYGSFIGISIFGEECSTLKNVMIPVGISFYTFQVIGFMIDTQIKGVALPPFLDYMNFVGFFPQIVAGPIERREHLLPQIERFRFKIQLKNLIYGIRYVILGLFYKLCLADNMAVFFTGGKQSNVILVWKDNLCFGLRIFFDFAGYALIAYGLAACFGIKLLMNFLSPYTATSISEFWRRWHTSLTQWFRDYIYFGMGGGRTKWWAFNILTVFLVSGVWHGAGWNFILWGGINGVFLIVHRLYKRTARPLWTPLAYALTMLSVFLVWLFFYETNTDLLMTKFIMILTPGRYTLESLRLAVVTMGTMLIPMTFIMVTAIAVIVAEWLGNRKVSDPYHYLSSDAACALWIFMIVFNDPGITNSFIYFSF